MREDLAVVLPENLLHQELFDSSALEETHERSSLQQFRSDDPHRVRPRSEVASSQDKLENQITRKAGLVQVKGQEPFLRNRAGKRNWRLQRVATKKVEDVSRRNP
jgi:hypothetical protein